MTHTVSLLVHNDTDPRATETITVHENKDNEGRARDVFKGVVKTIEALRPKGRITVEHTWFRRDGSFHKKEYQTIGA